MGPEEMTDCSSRPCSAPGLPPGTDPQQDPSPRREVALVVRKVSLTNESEALKLWMVWRVKGQSGSRRALPAPREASWGRIRFGLEGIKGS